MGAIFLAGGAPQGNLGVFLLCAGLALILCPPQRRLPPLMLFLAAALLGGGALALLPRRLFSEPAWRQALGTFPDLPLPSTVSAAPAQTLFWLAILAVTILLGLFLLTQSTRSHGLLALALGGACLCGLYAALSIFAKFSGWNYPFSGGATFGFLPNRNHTATLLVTGGILSLGVLVVALRERRWLTLDAAVAALAFCVVGLFFFSESRAGVVFLLVGVAGWVMGLGGRHRSRPLLLAAAVATLVALGLLLAVKSDVRDRLFRAVPTQQKAGTKPSSADHLTADDRLKIYRDTLAIIREAPLTGTGLGTFALIFPPYRKDLINSTLVLHPESDWLMLAAETGLPACLCLLGLVFGLLWTWCPDRTHPYWPLRWGVFMAAAAGVLHGLVDVPAHRAALGWWLLVLAGLALQAGGKSREISSASRPWLARAFFIVGGLGAILLGGQLVWAEWLGGPALPPFAAAAAQKQIVQTFDHGDPAEAMEQARAAVRRFPLVPPLYYQLGVLLLRFEDTDAEADRAFGLQRLLNPLAAEVPRDQAAAWLALDPARAAGLFTDSLRRQERLTGLTPAGGGAADYLQGLVQQASGVAAAQNLLWEAAVARGPKGELAWLEGVDPVVAKERLAQLATDEPFLDHLDTSQRQKFLAVWAQKDREGWQAFVQVRGEEWARPPTTSPVPATR